MKLANIAIEGFRAFTKRVEVDLSADVTILVGPNGTGKTSLLDAILWSITGHLRRVGDERVVSMYAPAGLARVALTLANASKAIRVIRTRVDDRDELTLEADQRTLEGPAAQQALLSKLWNAGLASESPLDDLHEVLTRSVYLQQDLVRQFLDRDSSSERFAAIGKLIGVGRIADFQRKMESQRNGWSRASKQKDETVATLEARLANVRQDLERLGRDGDSDAVQMWNRWWNDLREKGLGVSPIPEPTMSSAGKVLDQMLRALQATRSNLQRQQSMFPELRDDLRQVLEYREIPESRIAELRAALSNAKATRDALETSLVDIEKQAAGARAELVSEKNAAEDLRALATIALRHLSEHCPVCEQAIDPRLVAGRLKSVLEQGAPAESKTFDSVLSSLRWQMQEAVSNMARAQRDLEEATNANKAMESRRALLKSRLADLEISALDAFALDAREGQLKKQIDDITEAYSGGERLSVAVVRLSEESKRTELLEEEAATIERLTSARSEQDDYKKTYDEASKIIEAVRLLADDAVTQQIDKISPLLNKIYTRIDPHPTFRQADLRSYVSYGKGRVEAPVTDMRYKGGLEVDSPSQVFSSSQASALAVCIFLAMNLTCIGIPLQTAILDDPLQSLDDINLLGLLDVLRRIRTRRQLFISTHDENFATLLVRKFRPLEEGQRTSIVALSNWERSGVQLEQSTEDQIPPKLQVVS